MEKYTVWSGTRTWLPGDSGYEKHEIIGEELAVWEDAGYDSGSTYYVYRTENGVVIHRVRWTSTLGDPHYGDIFRFSSLEEAAQNDELRQALKDMRLI